MTDKAENLKHRIQIADVAITIKREANRAAVTLKWNNELKGESEGSNLNELLATAALKSIQQLCAGEVVLHLMNCWEVRASETHRFVIVKVRLWTSNLQKPEYVMGMAAVGDDPSEPAPVLAVLNALNRRLSKILPLKQTNPLPGSPSGP